MFAEQVQVQVRALATGERWWRRLCPASFVLAGITALIVWVAAAELLRQGHLGAVLSAGRAELAAPLLVADLDGRPVPVEQEASAGPALLLVARQLAGLDSTSSWSAATRERDARGCGARREQGGRGTPGAGCWAGCHAGTVWLCCPCRVRGDPA